MADGKLQVPADPAAVEAVIARFPDRLRACRERADLTVAQASTLAGLEAGQWRKFERGATEPGIRNLLRMQYALGLHTLEPLFDDTTLDALSARPSSQAEAA